MTAEEAFFTVHSGLDREGPGEASDVAWAVSLAGTPPDARILDAGCGPGGDIPALLEEAPAGHVTAVDTHAPFVDQVRRRFPPDRVTAVAGDMGAVPGTFDFVWCAGALYFLGLEDGLRVMHGKLGPGGALAFSEPCYFADDPSDDAVRFWDGYATRPQGAVLDAVAAAGFEVLGAKQVSDTAWTAYYAPMMARTALLAEGADDALRAAIDEAEGEYALWRRVRRETGYLLTVARRR